MEKLKAALDRYWDAKTQLEARRGWKAIEPQHREAHESAREQLCQAIESRVRDIVRKELEGGQ